MPLRFRPIGWMKFCAKLAFSASGTRVVSVESTVIGEGVGYLSSVARVKLGYDPPGAVENGAPASVVVKIEPANEVFRRLGQQFHAFEREIRFYREVAGRVDVRLPKIYYTLDEPPNYAIVMEDFGYCTPGDQLAGMHEQQVLTAARIMGRLQAQFWNNAALGSLEWMPATWDLWKHFSDHWPSFVGHCRQWLGPEHLLLGQRVAKHGRWIIEQMETVAADDRALRLARGQSAVWPARHAGRGVDRRLAIGDSGDGSLRHRQPARRKRIGGRAPRASVQCAPGVARNAGGRRGERLFVRRCAVSFSRGVPGLPDAAGLFPYRGARRGHCTGKSVVRIAGAAAFWGGVGDRCRRDFAELEFCIGKLLQSSLTELLL